MCHTRTVKYTCTHTITISLSTCRGTFTAPNRRLGPRKTLCRKTEALTLHAATRCGPCERQRAIALLEQSMAAVRFGLDGAGDVAELREAEGRYDWQLWELERQYPDRTRIWWEDRDEGEIESRMTGVRRQSLLRNEVLAEDVVLEIDGGQGAWDWGSWDDVGPPLNENAGEDGLEEGLDSLETSEELYEGQNGGNYSWSGSFEEPPSFAFTHTGERRLRGKSHRLLDNGPTRRSHDGTESQENAVGKPSLPDRLVAVNG